MSIACEFGYVKPTSIREASKWLSKRGQKVMALAGGSDLVAWLRDGVVQPDVLVDIKGIPGLGGIQLKGAKLWIGSLTTYGEILESDLIVSSAPVFHEAASVLASVGVRNRATLAGNVCSAVPCCDGGPALLVYDAVVLVEGQKGKRRIPMDEWFLGPRKTALKPGELVTGFQMAPKKHGGAFAKLKRYRGEDLAQASVAVTVTENGKWKVAYGSVAPTPIRGPKVEAILKGNVNPDDAVLAKAAAAAMEEVAPITDIRSSKEYRRLMIGVMVRRAARLAARRLAGEKIPYGTNAMEEDV